MRRQRPHITKKYAICLSMLANSFYDPECGANLFKSVPIYQFNHKPTRTIKESVASGRLIDLVGNILDEEAGSNTVNVDKIRADVRAELEPIIKAELEPVIRAEVEKELQKEFDKKLKSEVAKAKKEAAKVEKEKDKE